MMVESVHMSLASVTELASRLGIASMEMKALGASFSLAAIFRRHRSSAPPLLRPPRSRTRPTRAARSAGSVPSGRARAAPPKQRPSERPVPRVSHAAVCVRGGGVLSV